MQTNKDKFLQRIDQLLEKAEKVKATHEPNPSGVIGFPTLDADVFFEWKTNSENLIIFITGKGSVYHENFIDKVKGGYRGHVGSGIGILKALKEDIELGYLRNIKELIAAEIFTDFLDIASHLLDNGYKDPAASLIGAVLEDGLRKIAERNNISVKNNDDISSLNTKIADKEAYSRLVQKQIQAWKAVRDSADHGRFNDYKHEDVKSMLEGVGRFLAENM